MYKKVLSFFHGYCFIYIILLLVYAGSNVLLVYVSSVLLERVVDGVAIYGVSEALFRNLYLLIYFLVIAAINFGIQYIKFNFYNLLKHRITIKIYSNIINAPYQRIIEYNSGDLYSSVNSDLPLALSFFDKIEGVMLKIACSLGSALYIFQMDARMGMVIIGFGILIVVYNRIISPYFKKIQSNIQIDNSNIEKYTTEQYKSYLIRRFYNYNTLTEKYNKAYEDYIESNLKRMKYGALTSIVGYMIGFLQTYIPLFLVATLFNGYSVGEVIALIGNITAFIAVFRAFGNLLVGVKASAAGAERLLPLLNSIYENKKECSKFKDDDCEIYKINNLKFKYENSNFNLNIANLVLKSNTKIGFVGEKGCGKSTLIKILAGLYQDYSGEIELMGNKLKEMSQQCISSKVAYLPQSFPVFDMTIYENFKLVAPDKDEDEYMRYAAYVNIDTEILKMENGIHTQINSNNISTGQRQRLSLCMVLLRDTPVVILDEPTSSLDVANKELIFELIVKNELEKLYIVTTHDHDKFTSFDVIYHMADGEICNL